jgi:hypothetical protein
VWSIYFDDPLERRAIVVRQSRVVYPSYEMAYGDAQIAFEQSEANRTGRRPMRVFYLIDPGACHLHDHLREQVDLSARRLPVQRARVSPDKNPRRLLGADRNKQRWH